MNPDDKLLNKELRRDEGVRYVPYFDTVGIETTGVGHNMVANPLPKHWRFPLSDEQVDQLLAMDLDEVFEGLDRAIPWWRRLSYARQRVLVNMCFNLGLAGLLSFKNTLLAIQESRWMDASGGMLSSKWAKQVGKRADRLAEMMRVG